MNILSWYLDKTSQELETFKKKEKQNLTLTFKWPRPSNSNIEVCYNFAIDLFDYCMKRTLFLWSEEKDVEYFKYAFDLQGY